MKSPFLRMTTVAVVLLVCSGQVLAHGGYRHHRGGYYGNSGLWIGGATLLGAGTALALTSGPRYGYSGVTYVRPPVYYSAPIVYPPPVYYPAPVQYAPPAYVVSTVPTVTLPSLNVVAYPAKGQSESQQQQDRQECQRWAMNQSGLDPSNITEYTTGASTDLYTRSLGACFKGKGYSIN